MANVWFTADTHFYHKNIIGYEQRPWDNVYVMNKALIDNWNAVVEDDDVIIHVGDVAFCNALKLEVLLGRLKGQKILVRGNHDPSAAKALAAGFAIVVEQMWVNIGGKSCLVCHYPYKPKKGFSLPQVDLKYLDRRPKNDGQWLIHGHVHGKWKVRDKQICVAVENWKYGPVHVKELEKIICG